MVAPGSAGPLAAGPSGGSSARCMEPSRLVCPTVATALAGTATSGLHRDIDVGMPVVHGHPADAADHDVVDHDGRIRLQCADIGDLDVVGRPRRRRVRQCRAAAASSRPRMRIRSRSRMTHSQQRRNERADHDGAASRSACRLGGQQHVLRRRPAMAAHSADRREQAGAGGGSPQVRTAGGGPGGGP